MRRPTAFSPTTTKGLLRNLTAHQHIILTGRAAAGIWAALRAWDFRDRVVLLPANTCYIVLWAVLKSGNRPLLLDIDPLTGNIDVGQLPAIGDQPPYPGQPPNKNSVLGTQHSALSPERPAAIIPCHMYGLGAPMGTMRDWAQAHNVKVIEDVALALGARVQGRPAGAWGDVAVFSFGLGKLLDNQVGGALMTDDAALAREVERVLAEAPMWDERLMRLTTEWHGLYWSLHQYEATNPRLLALYPQLYDIYSDVTLYRLENDEWNNIPNLLRELPDNLAQRARMAAIYDEILIEPQRRGERRDQMEGDYFHTLLRPEGSVLWKYPLIVSPDIRADLLGYLWEQGIHDATRWYPPLRHMMSALLPDVNQSPTPGADRLGASIINLPLGTGIDEAYARRVAALVRAFYQAVI